MIRKDQSITQSLSAASIFAPIGVGSGLGLFLWLLIARRMTHHIHMDDTTFHHGLIIAGFLAGCSLIFALPLLRHCSASTPAVITWMQATTRFVLYGLLSGALLFSAVLSLRPAELGPVGRPFVALILGALSLGFFMLELILQRRAALRQFPKLYLLIALLSFVAPLFLVLDRPPSLWSATICCITGLLFDRYLLTQSKIGLQQQ